MSKQKKKTAGKNAWWEVFRQRKPLSILLCAAAVVLVVAVVLAVRPRERKLSPLSQGSPVSAESNVEVYRRKLALLEAGALTEETEEAVGKGPAGGQAGYAVFLSVCNTAERATVFCGTGAGLRSAWGNADAQVMEFLSNSNYDPVWVKADVVYTSKILDAGELSEEVKGSRSEFFRYGIAFDRNYNTALLEAELNGAKIYDYENGGLDFEYLNRYLAKADRAGLEELPETYTLFQCLGWFCDETDTVYELHKDGLEYGRRDIPQVDDAYVMQLMANAGDYLVEQVNPDGSFVYGKYPRFDKDISGYDIVRHAGAIWALACQYRLTGDEKFLDVIEPTIDYLMESVAYADENTAYVLKGRKNEIELGAGGLTVVALTEYMDAVGSDRYLDVCRDLGNGILSQLDQETGEFYHVLNDDFTRKEQFRVIYYDGEAVFALCRLYGMTGEQVWLDAAESAVDHFIEADYIQYKDHWVAYSMNEITKYVDDPAYYTFGLRNAQENLKRIGSAETIYPTNLELLMATFELYERIQERGIQVEYLEDGFHLDEFLKTVTMRIDRILDGYFYPEYAMYMTNPQQTLNTFMVRHDGFRVRIDDVQHPCGGLYLYYKYYDKLVSYGLSGG